MNKKLTLWITIFSVSLLGTGYSWGNLFNKSYNNPNIYSQSEFLELSALNKIYIQSDFPVKIISTTGIARASYEISERSIQPNNSRNFDFDIKTSGDMTFINLSTNDFPFVFEEEGTLIVELPQVAIDTLKISNSYSTSYNYRASGMATDDLYDLNKLSIDNLVLDNIIGELSLDGSYKNLSITNHWGNLKINSQTPADILVSSSSGTVTLDGYYNSISTEDATYRYNNANYNITNNNPNIKSLDLNNSGVIDTLILNGYLADFNIYKLAERANITSLNPISVILENIYGNVQLSGQYTSVDLSAYTMSSEIDVALNFTNQPDVIKLNKINNIQISLPQDITGFQIYAPTNEENNNTSYVGNTNTRYNSKDTKFDTVQMDTTFTMPSSLFTLPFRLISQFDITQTQFDLLNYGEKGTYIKLENITGEVEILSKGVTNIYEANTVQLFPNFIEQD